MTKEIIKVSYLPLSNDETGTIYRKRFTISQRVYQDFTNALLAEGALEKDYYKRLYLQTPTKRLLDIVFLNLTQADYFIKRYLKCADVELNEKRAKYIANACLIIK